MQEPEDNEVADATQKMNIQTRLAALNRWQEEQKRLLEDRQNKQREILSQEQRNMYQMLGLLHSEDNQAVEGEIEMPRHAGNFPEDIETEGNAKARPAPVRPKQPFLRRGEGLKQRFKIHPEQLRLDNLPPYKFANSHQKLQRRSLPVQKQKKSILKPNKNRASLPSVQPAPAPLDCHEERFQQLLIRSRNACNSTPDLKSSQASVSTSTSTSHATISTKVRFADDEEDTSQASPMAGACWAKVLDTQQIQPLPLLQHRSAQIRVEDDSNVSIFELLEQKAREGNIDMNSSCIRAFMGRKEQRAQADESDQILVTQQMKSMRLQPEVHEVITDNEELDEENEATECNSTLTLTPIQVGKTQVRVRFSDSNDTHEYNDESSLGNVELFEQFKTVLFQALEKKKAEQAPPPAPRPASPSPRKREELPLAQELQAKTDLVRTRLEELEKEIADFKRQNLELLRLKQQHELDQAKCAQEHQEAMERVHDEKIQAEIYLHDERMKIEEERRKCEQQMRMQKSNMNTKEKKELAALKQEIESLQLQMKQKDQAHVSAQARLRAQLRASEKEQRNYRDEIELVSRENKRLEQELVKLGRESNNKMLHEINRNIARLAPKIMMSSTCVHDENGQVPKPLEKPVAKQKETNRRNHHKNHQNQSRNRSRQPEPLNESYASTSSTDSMGITQLKEPPVAAAATPAKKKSPGENTSTEFKREIVNEDGSKDIWYPNGNLKKISADGMSVRMLYFNKDIKETDIRQGTVKYYYAETNTWHTTYLDGLEILEFPNGQTEHRLKNGVVEVHFPNNTVKVTDPNYAEKQEEWRYADGSQMIQMRNGDKILSLANGQKEIHTKLNKRREYPDGTVKLVYPDGSQETRYSNGRVRLKDKDGKLLMDTDYAKY